MNFSGRFVKWFRLWILPLVWLFVNIAPLLWIWGWLPQFIKWVLPPMPHTWRLMAAPIIALFLVVIVFNTFWVLVVYKKINPYSWRAIYDQSPPRYWIQCLIAVGALIISAVVMEVVSSWFWLFHWFFALGWGAFAYLLQDGYALTKLQYAPSSAKDPYAEPEIILKDPRGLKEGKVPVKEFFKQDTDPIPESYRPEQQSKGTKTVGATIHQTKAFSKSLWQRLAKMAFQYALFGKEKSLPMPEKAARKIQDIIQENVYAVGGVGSLLEYIKAGDFHELPTESKGKRLT